MDSKDNAHGFQGRPHLGDSINAATRTLHAKLNRAILQHFPLALPPHATTPFTYAMGLLHIAPIYLTFESLWQDIIDTRGDVSPNSETKPSPFDTSSSQPEGRANPRSPTTHNPPPCEPRILALLQALHHPLLSRTTPLLSDIRTITIQHNPTPTAIPITLLTEAAAFSSQQQPSRQPNGNSQRRSTQQNPHPNPQQAQAPPHTNTTQQLNTQQPNTQPNPQPNTQQTTHNKTAQHPNPNPNTHQVNPPPNLHQPAFLSRIKQSVRARPHVLLAYAWVFYMALFSGGRVLRGLLEGAGEEFWDGFGDGFEGGGFEDGGFEDVGRGGGGVWGRAGGRTGGGGVEGDVEGGAEGGAESGRAIEAGFGSGSKKGGLPLRFFRFDTPRDGEDLKVEFKERFGEAGRALTDQERDEVVGEAGEIFEDMILLVAELDRMLGKDKSSDRLGVGKRRGKMVIADGELASGTGRKGAEPAPGFGAWYTVAGALLIVVGLWARYAWK